MKGLRWRRGILSATSLTAVGIAAALFWAAVVSDIQNHADSHGAVFWAVCATFLFLISLCFLLADLIKTDLGEILARQERSRQDGA